MKTIHSSAVTYHGLKPGWELDDAAIGTQPKLAAIVILSVVIMITILLGGLLFILGL